MLGVLQRKRMIYSLLDCIDMERHVIFNSKQRAGLDYTDRQMAILNDEIHVDMIRTNELAAIMKRAKECGDEDYYEIAQGYYLRKKNPSTYIPTYTIEEAKNVLQSLTPWKINWWPKKV